MVVAKAPDMLFLGILVTSLTSNPLLPTIKVRQEVSRSQEGEGRKGEELRHGGVRSSQLKRKHWKKEGQRARAGRVRACVNAG